MPSTRFYLPSSGAPDISPAFDAWEDTSFATRIMCGTAKTSTALTDFNRSFPSDDTPFTAVYRQYISGAIGSIDFTGKNITMVVRGLTGSSAKLSLSARLYHADTTLEALLAITSIASSYPATAKTRIVGSTALASVTSIAGDRLVVEIGALINPTVTATTTLRFGDNAASDFTLTTDLTTDLNPWFEIDAVLGTTSASTSSFLSFF